MKTIFMVLASVMSASTWAAQITVDSNEFDANANGNCNFGEAVLSAGFDLAFDQCTQGSGDDVILFDPGLFPAPLNTLFLTVDDTLLVFGDGIDIQVPAGKTLSLDSDGNQPIFQVDLNPNSAFSMNRSVLKNAGSDTNGGAIQFDEDVDDVHFMDVVFENNSTTSQGGAIGFERAGGATNLTTVRLDNCQFISNSAGNGGAIYAPNFVQVVVNDTDFINNTAADVGGALRVGDDLDANGVVFNGNQAQFGGGVFASGGVANIQNSLFELNTGISQGGALYKANQPEVTTTALEFRRNSVINNSAESGAGLFVRNNQLFFINNLVANNVASDGVGGLHNDLGSAVNGIHQVRIIGNSFYQNDSQGSANAVADIQAEFSDAISTYVGNAVVSQANGNATQKCHFSRINAVLSKHNLSSEDDACLVGEDNQLLANPVVEYSPQMGLHPHRLTPLVTSPLIDSWDRNDCYDHNNTLLDFDLTGRRNHSGLLDIYNGDGDDQGHCDIGSSEVPDAVLVAVGQIGMGSGRIYGNPETAIDCPGPAVCEQAIGIGEQVTFNTQAYAGSRFIQWGLDGAACGTSPSCELTVPDTAIVVSAEFELIPTYTLEVQKPGSGSGLVYSEPVLTIDCGATCLAVLSENEMITLQATAGSGDVFEGWSGACSGLGACDLIMDQDHSVVATFSTGYELMVISQAGGTVTSVDSGIQCPNDCVELYAEGAMVSLIAQAEAGFVFTGWSGGCGGENDCALTMNGDQSVSAHFAVDDEIFTDGFDLPE